MDRELVLSRLYLLHTSTSNTSTHEAASSSCSTAESAFLPTAVRVYERERIDSDLTSEPTEDVQAAGYYMLYFVILLFRAVCVSCLCINNLLIAALTAVISVVGFD